MRSRRCPVNIPHFARALSESSGKTTFGQNGTSCSMHDSLESGHNSCMNLARVEIKAFVPAIDLDRSIQQTLDADRS